jgi:hypothetical protein
MRGTFWPVVLIVVGGLLLLSNLGILPLGELKALAGQMVAAHPDPDRRFSLLKKAAKRLAYRICAHPVQTRLAAASPCSACPHFPPPPCCPGAGAAQASTASTLNALPRTALVIGNSRYKDAPLKNPANDAGAIAENLKKLGFNVVSQLDAGRIAMENAIRSYGEQLAKSKGVGLFYYAGHGLQVSWRNFLVPVDASLGRAMTSRARRSIWPPC